MSRHDDVPSTQDDRLSSAVWQQRSTTPFDDLADDDLRRHVYTVLELLPERLAYVLICRFFRGWTLQECADSMNVTREYCRQLELRALRRARQVHAVPELRRARQLYAASGDVYESC